MKLWAVSDLHAAYAENFAFVRDLPAYPNDGLILGGDVCESADDLARVLELVVPRFDTVWWVPGNHELWSMAGDPFRGVAKYAELVRVCRQLGVWTPEDPYACLPGTNTYVAPLFVLYDYSFRPPHVSRAGALAWATEAGAVCADEMVLFSEPFATRDDWCAARVAYSLQRLGELPANARTVLVNHFPLRQHHAVLPAIPRFTLWCGTTQTETWHLRFRAEAVVYGHLHLPAFFIEDNVVFHEVSFGYPREKWRRSPRGLRLIWSNDEGWASPGGQRRDGAQVG
jgi:Calcineurin-like phosphoesterase